MTTNKNKPRKVNTNCRNCDSSIHHYDQQCYKTGRYVSSHYKNSTRPGWCPLRKEEEKIAFCDK